MKFRDVVKDTPEWKELFEIAMDILDAANVIKDHGLYITGVRLQRAIAHLAEVEIPEKEK